MFVGHYSAAFAARAIQPSVPLGLLFVAVQLIDYAFVAFVMVNIEDVGRSPIALYFMPFSHGLMAVSIWALAAGLLYATMIDGGRRISAGLVLALAVISHLVLDAFVHVPDLPIGYGEPRLDFALNPGLFWGQAIEFGVLLAGFALYIANTRPTHPAGRIAPWLLLGLIVALQVFNLTTRVQPGQSVFALGALTLAAFSVLAVVAAISSRYRGSRRVREPVPAPAELPPVRG